MRLFRFFVFGLYSRKRERGPFGNTQKAVGMNQFKTSLFISWLIISAVIFVVLLLPHVMGGEQILALTPECQSVLKYGKPCFFCGVTRAFIAITKGDYQGAMGFNPFSIYLYLVFSINAVVALFFSLKWAMVKPRRPQIANP
jgi:hypothetical protein